MALNDLSETRTLNTVTETAALQTVLWRNMIETPDGGGVFPDYPVSCKYASATYEVDENGHKVRIIEKNLNPHEIVFRPEELYPLYMLPITLGDGTQTVLGELLCDKVDEIIQARKLEDIISAHPAPQSILAGDSVTLSVRVDKNEIMRLSYSVSWYKNGSLIEGATSLELTDTPTEDSTYEAWITTSFGVSKSNPALVTLVTA